MKISKIIENSILSAKRGGWFGAASVIVMAFTFFMLTIFITSALISNDVLEYLESRAQITIFFKDEATEESILSYKSSLEADSRVVEVSYTSKDQALEEYINSHQDEPLLLESLSKDIFPASLDIRAKDISDLSAIASSFEGNEDIEETVFYEDALSAFKKVSNVIKFGGLSLVILLSLTSVVIVLLTIGSSIHVRKDEIGIMRLVGGSKWYIRGPFIVQGLLYGFIATLVSQALFVLLAAALNNDIRLLFKGIPIMPLDNIYLIEVFVFQLVFGSLLSLAASFAAIRRYIRL